MERDSMRVPWPPESSFHPWSIDLRSVWLDKRGGNMGSCEEMGVRNHISLEKGRKVSVRKLWVFGRGDF